MAVRLTGDEWAHLTLQLLVRSGGMCEARTPRCLAGPDGRISDRADGRPVRHSRHHRLPRGTGGSALPGQHSLDRLLIICGDGVTGCHGHIESARTWAFDRGFLVHRGMDPAAVPVVLASGRRVLLDAGGGFYVDDGWDFRDFGNVAD